MMHELEKNIQMNFVTFFTDQQIIQLSYTIIELNTILKICDIEQFGLK